MDKIKYYNSIINEYKIIRNEIHYKNDFINYICEQKNLNNVIEKSVLSRNRNGKIFPHQERVYTSALENCLNNYLNISNKIKKQKPLTNYIIYYM